MNGTFVEAKLMLFGFYLYGRREVVIVGMSLITITGVRMTQIAAMITLGEVASIHEILIDKFDGSKGIRDRGILESAINRPFQTFDQNELYPLPVDKAAAIFESIISNHPFVEELSGQHTF